ncbi:MAG: MOSC domain-containing protein [Chloroflexi bacterium]|nr:MAG: MOSC domain-containing protein [Chloroflexota bacterium]
MNHKPMLRSLQVGAVRMNGSRHATDPLDRPWRSAFYKLPVSAPTWLGKTTLAGDEQESEDHGGPDKAVLGYAASHYPLWRAEPGLSDMPHGGFGENFTIDGLTENSVCIGDVYRIGDAIVQVTQPRQPCTNIARRWHMKYLPKRVQQTGRTGWYHRVIEEGMVEVGIAVDLLERPSPEWTVARASIVMVNRARRRAEAEELADLPSLSASWRETLAST